MIRSPSAEESVKPASDKPLPRRSTQTLPSGFNITSTTSGSSSSLPTAGPSAVRSMRTVREAMTDTPSDAGMIVVSCWIHLTLQRLSSIAVILPRLLPLLIGPYLLADLAHQAIAT